MHISVHIQYESKGLIVLNFLVEKQMNKHSSKKKYRQIANIHNMMYLLFEKEVDETFQSHLKRKLTILFNDCEILDYIVCNVV